MKARIEEVLSRILSRKHDAKITIKFEEKEKCPKQKTKSQKV